MPSPFCIPQLVTCDPLLKTMPKIPLNVLIQKEYNLITGINLRYQTSYIVLCNGTVSLAMNLQLEVLGSLPTNDTCRNKCKQNVSMIFTCTLCCFPTHVYFHTQTVADAPDKSWFLSTRKLQYPKWSTMLQRKLLPMSCIPSQQCGGIPLKVLCLFSSILVHHKKTFRDSQLLKYLINKELMTFSNKIQAKTFTWPDMSFYAR